VSKATVDNPLADIARAHAAASPRLRGGGDWQRRRADALARLLERGLPDRRDENWKYLDWPEIQRRQVAPPAAPGAGAQPKFEPTARCGQCGTHVPRDQLDPAGLCARCRTPGP